MRLDMDKQSKTVQENRRGSRRKAPRGIVRVECRRGSFGLGANIATGLLDLSEGGVRILCREPLKVKEKVEITFQTFAILHAIKHVGHVTWALPLENGQHAAGIEFENRLPYEDFDQLARP
jgi:hypothetical protein